MQSGPRAACRLYGVAMAASLGFWCAVATGDASADGAARVPERPAESEPGRPPQADDDPFEDEIVPPPGQSDEEEDEGQVEEGCLFMERPLELIV